MSDLVDTLLSSLQPATTPPANAVLLTRVPSAQDSSKLTFGALLPGAIGGAGVTPVEPVTASGAAVELAPAAEGDICYYVTLKANCTFTLGEAQTGQYQRVILVLEWDATGGWTPTMPAGVKWANDGIPPNFDTTAGAVAEVTFATPNASQTWLGKY